MASRNSGERLAVFIDGPALYSAARALGFQVDYRKIVDLYSEEGNLVRVYYYEAVRDDAEFSAAQPLRDWLDYNGFAVVTKPVKEFVDFQGRRKVKANMDVDMAVDILELAPHLDHVVLFSGDGSLRCLVEAVQRKGVRVTVVSTYRSTPPMVADELRRQADVFVDLAELASHIARAAPGTQARGAGPGTLQLRPREAVQ